MVLVLPAIYFVSRYSYNLFHAFYTLNLKPALRDRTTMLMAGRLVLAELLMGSTEMSRPP